MQAKMPAVAYVDADLEISVEYVRNCVELFKIDSVHLCTGSKLTTTQRRIRPSHRKLASIGYNLLVRLVLNSKVSDHQCGIKGYRQSLLKEILPDAREEGWAIDTEMLLLAQKRGYHVYEFPVELTSKRKSTVPFLKTVFTFLGKIIEFRLRGLRL